MSQSQSTFTSSHANSNAEPGANSFISLLKESLIGTLSLCIAMPLYGSDFNKNISHLLWGIRSQWKMFYRRTFNKDESRSEVERNWRGLGDISECSEIKPMLKNGNLRNYFLTSQLHSVTIKEENDSLMSTQMRTCTTQQSHQCWGSMQNSSKFKLPSFHEQGILFSATQQYYQEHPKIPLLPDHRESVNLQGKSSMCWQKQTAPKEWILEEAHQGANARQAIICRSHTPGTAFLILVFSKLFAQKHAFNAERSCSPLGTELKGMGKKTS